MGKIKFPLIGGHSPFGYGLDSGKKGTGTEKGKGNEKGISETQKPRKSFAKPHIDCYPIYVEMLDEGFPTENHIQHDAFNKNTVTETEPGE